MTIDFEFCEQAIFFKIFKEYRPKIFGNINEYRTQLLYPETFNPMLSENGRLLSGRKSYFLLAKYRDDFIGWSFGFQTRYDEMYMVNSAVFPEYRRKGIYTKMLQKVLSWSEKEGFVRIHSSHRFDNTEVLTAKLKAGFIISGFEVRADFGNLVNLSYFTIPEVKKVFLSRLGYQNLSEETIQKLKGK